MQSSRYLPFYMAYLGSGPDAERKEQKETRICERQEAEERWIQSYYPENMRIIQKIAEQVCDEEDYAGSRIYDECPDRHMLEKTKRKAAVLAAEALPDLQPETAEAAAGLLLLQEIRRRRCRKGWRCPQHSGK